MSQSPELAEDSRFLRKVAFHFGDEVEARCRNELQQVPAGHSADRMAILDRVVRDCFGPEIAAGEALANKPCSSD